MTKSKLNGKKKGLGFYELMTAPEEVYRKALQAAERNDFKKFCGLLGIQEKEDKNENHGTRL